MMRVALDNDILAYAEGVGDAPRCARAIGLIEKLPPNRSCFPRKHLGSFFGF